MRRCRTVTVEVHYADEGVAIGSCGCVVLFAWRGDVTLERVVAGEAVIRERAAACPRAIALLTVVEDGAPPPSGEPERRVRESLEELGEQVVGTAIVFEGAPGWLAWALDGIATVASMMRRKLPQKHTVSRREACLWVQRRFEGVPEAPSRDRLLAALEQVQSAILVERRAQ